MSASTRKSSYASGIKALMTAISLVITLAGWALLAWQDKPQPPVIPQPPAISSLSLPLTSSPAVLSVQPTMVAQPTLRVVNPQNVAPVVTRSSR